MPFTRRGVRAWTSLQYDEFLTLYENEQFKTLLKYLERRIKSDFIRILATTGHVGDVYFTARVKKPFSTFDKLGRAIADRRKKRQDQLQGPVLYELIRDLVAIRLICIDSTSAADIVRRIVTSDTLAVVPTCEFYRQLTKRKDVDYVKFSQILRPIFADGFSESKKSSGYESVHLEVNFFGALDKYEKSLNQLGSVFSKRVEEINNLRRQMSDGTASQISLFPIEVQVRTFTQHIWARDEQKVIYTPSKSGQHIRKNDGLTRAIRTEFRELKKALIHAEAIRARIQSLEEKRVKRSLSFVGKSYEVSSRIFYFELQNFSQYIDRINKFDKQLSTLKLSRPSKVNGRFTDTVLEILKGIIDLCEEIERYTGEGYLAESESRLSEGYWGRQRVILLIVGYLLLFSDEQTLRDVLDYSAMHTRLDSILGLGNKIDLGRAAAARIYEHILTNDRVVSLKHPQRRFVFQDPIVYSRLASSRYRDEDYFGAAASMTELFRNDWWDSFWQGARPRVDGPKRYQFHMRRAEYLWYHGSRMGDRSEMYETIVSDLTYCMNNGGAEDGKIVSWIILVATIMHGRERAKSDFTRIAATAEKCLDTLKESERVNVSDKFYYVAAFGVKLLRNRQQSKGLGQIECARNILKRGIPHPKGAIAIALQMCDEIEVVFRERLPD